MKKLAATLCFAALSLSVAACTTNDESTYNSSASYATDRTAGQQNTETMKKPERVFKSYQSK